MANAARGKAYKVVLIEEGLGNLKDLMYYTREALEYAAENAVFEGKKMYADHPDKIQEVARPERSVRDIGGHYESVAVEDGPAGQALLVGNLVTVAGDAYDWLRSLLDAALDFSGKFNAEMVGLSINAAGMSEKKSLDDFMDGATIPISAQDKLLKAKSEGASEIEVCTALQEAVSCDLVTEAGARGRVLKMLEGERQRMAKQTPKPAQAPKKPAREGDAPMPPKKTPDGDGGDAGHADAEQDTALVKKLMAQYMKKEDPSAEEMETFKQAIKHAEAAGYEGEKAHEAAGHAMQIAHQAATAEAESETETEEAEEEESEVSTDDGAGDGTPAPAPKKGGKMESEVIKLTGKIQALEAQLAKTQLDKDAEKLIRESGLTEGRQKKFRECLGGYQSTKDVTDKLKIFKEAIGTVQSVDGFLPEKFEQSTSDGLDLSDCVQ